MPSASYSKKTGTKSVMSIYDNGSLVEFWMQIPGDSYASELPWAYTVNGKTSWQSYKFLNPGYTDNPPPFANYQFYATAVSYSQTVVFQIGDSNDNDIGGPTELSVYINRSAGGAGVIIQVGNELKKAIPYVNVNGTWRVAEPWSKLVGEWKQTT